MTNEHDCSDKKNGTEMESAVNSAQELSEKYDDSDYVVMMRGNTHYLY